ncbi:hypothetical protein GCK72_013218 [Caenorhabditis remanei]|uniref:PAN-3 domain-containing protein n=1 Tax=Caenorhabditis remanei TaxID=31234 RepID=A0A6A5GQ60_CAERE|nr:hypothetical protein GCK72_013218 [Caenorhabditis remanei]KAF1756764.1 hypothetical protein GCK72_013218 [Caenorhabditis remanei]
MSCYTLRFLVLFAFILLSSLNESVNLLLFWGYPSDTSETKYCDVQSESGNFESCMDLCLKSNTCMLAFGTDNSCTLCDTYSISVITQTNASNGIKTAIKIDQQQQCPSMQNDLYTRSDTPDNYTLSFSNSIWKLSYGKKCVTDSWKIFLRPAGPTCIKVEKAPKFINYTETAKSVGGAYPTLEYTSVWLTGTMKIACYQQPTPSNCTDIKAFQAFAWQNNFDSYKFAPGYPTFVKSSSNQYQKCLQMMIAQKSEDWDGMITNTVLERISLILLFHSLGFLAFALHIITQVFQLLISLVAIRKFIIYFYPSSIPRVVDIQKTLTKYIWTLYVSIMMKELICLYRSIISTVTVCDEEETITLYSLSTLIISFSYYLGTFGFFSIAIDIVSTPFIVQISYLCMNKNSVKRIFTEFKYANFMRILMNIEVKSTVEPEIPKPEVETTRV